MKNLIQAVAVAAVLAVPVTSFAQSQPNTALTRAQVRAELVQLEHAGWRPGADSNTNYPEELQAAEQKVAAPNGADTSGYGGVGSTAHASGHPVASSGVSTADWDAMYRHP